MSVVENSASYTDLPSRTLRNLSRIFSRQLVLQEVFRSSDIVMAFFKRLYVQVCACNPNKAAVVLAGRSPTIAYRQYAKVGLRPTTVVPAGTDKGGRGKGFTVSHQ